MAFQKFRADQLFDGSQMLDDGHVLITSESGSIEEIVDVGEAGDDIRVLQGILCPGFTNCHCHLELSHMKGRIPERTGLIEFVTRIIEEAESEMIKEGIVAVGDICNNTLTITQKSKGRILYHNFIEASGLLDDMAEIRFERAVKLFSAYEQQNLPGNSNSIVPHAPYSVSEELWKRIVHFPANKLMTIH